MIRTAIRKLATVTLLVVASFTTAFTASQIVHAMPASAAVVTVTPAQEAAACIAVYHYHHVVALRYVNQLPSWDHAWHLAGYADADLKHAIRHYLTTGYGWSVVAYDCGSGL